MGLSSRAAALDNKVSLPPIQLLQWQWQQQCPLRKPSTTLCRKLLGRVDPKSPRKDISAHSQLLFHLPFFLSLLDIFKDKNSFLHFSPEHFLTQFNNNNSI